MASWKKMAEAFGRAVHNRERLTDHAPLSNKGRQKAEQADAIEDKRWERMANEADAVEEFRHGFNDEELLPDNGSDIRDDAMTEFVPAKEFSSVQRNQAELDDAITAALDKRYGTDERAKAQARRTVIEDLKNGTEVSTVLDRLDPSRWDDAFRETTRGGERDWLGIINAIKNAGFSESDILRALDKVGR